MNILAGRRLVPELLQSQFTADRTVAALEPMLADPAERSRVVEGLAALRRSLGPAGASSRAAEAVVSLLARLGWPRRPGEVACAPARTASGEP